MSTQQATDTNEKLDNSDDFDDLSHYFCKDQGNVHDKPAMARCGKVKSDWKDAPPNYPVCAVCYEMSRNGKCAHCEPTP